VSTPNHGMYVEVRGQGPTLVLLHGWGLNVRVWDTLANTLSDRFTIVAVDLPGHGRSTWSDEARTLSGLARCVQQALVSSTSINTTQGVTLLGWSLGGQVALEMAAQQTGRAHADLDAATSLAAQAAHRDRGHASDRINSANLSIEKLVLVATTPKFGAADDWPAGMPAATLNGFAQQLERDYRRTVSDFLELQVRGSANSDAVLATMRAALFEHGEASREALTLGLRILELTDLRPKLPEVQQPALVIAGQYDRVTSSRAGQALAASLPHAQFLEIRRAGHAPFLSHTDAFLDALNSFLATHAS
jgi:pimeloyl-[acyl-carrier protein] methyl ester esterase